MCSGKLCGILFLLLLSMIAIHPTIIRHDEICGEFNGRRMYIDLDEHGILEAKNQSNVKEIFDTERNRQCSLELVTCPSCIIHIQFTFLNISRNCGKTPVLDTCGCDYVWIYEPPFEEVSGEQFCGHYVRTNNSNLVYDSRTRSAAIAFLFNGFYEHAFTVEYTSKRSRQIYEGYPRYNNINSGVQYLTSPFFPTHYPRDLNTEYFITCKIAEDCKVRLIFTDFQLSPNSLIEFFDWNGQRMYVTTGSIFRPPLLISTGPSMMIRFYANRGTNLGFRASYVFFMGAKDNSTIKPNTACGGYVDNLGGRITMMDMIEDQKSKAYDCFWIIRPPNNYLHLKTQLYLKVVTFSGFAGNTELVIHQDVTSSGAVVELLRQPGIHSVSPKKKEHIVPITQGFYVSLKGIFYPESRLAIVYTAFNYKDCYSSSDFLCRNLRCIPAYLMCDGFDHCGDNSDETTNCLEEQKERLLWSHTPNFFFPKTAEYSYLKTSTIVFVICSFGLICLIFTLIILLYRVNSRNRCQGTLQSHLQTINDMLEEGPSGGVIEEEIIIADDPPLYEAPPNYEDIVKIVANRRIKKNIPTQRRLCSRCDSDFSSNSLARAELQNLTTNVTSEGECLQCDNNLSSTSRSSQTTPLPVSVPPFPVTPPPRYSAVDFRIRCGEDENSSRDDDENISRNDENSSRDDYENCSRDGDENSSRDDDKNSSRDGDKNSSRGDENSSRDDESTVVFSIVEERRRRNGAITITNPNVGTAETLGRVNVPVLSVTEHLADVANVPPLQENITDDGRNTECSIDIINELNTVNEEQNCVENATIRRNSSVSSICEECNNENYRITEDRNDTITGASNKYENEEGEGYKVNNCDEGRENEAIMYANEEEISTENSFNVNVEETEHLVTNDDDKNHVVNVSNLKESSGRIGLELEAQSLTVINDQENTDSITEEIERSNILAIPQCTIMNIHLDDWNAKNSFYHIETASDKKYSKSRFYLRPESRLYNESGRYAAYKLGNRDKRKLLKRSVSNFDDLKCIIHHFDAQCKLNTSTESLTLSIMNETESSIVNNVLKNEADIFCEDHAGKAQEIASNVMDGTIKVCSKWEKRNVFDVTDSWCKHLSLQNIALNNSKTSTDNILLRAESSEFQLPLQTLKSFPTSLNRRSSSDSNLFINTDFGEKIKEENCDDDDRLMFSGKVLRRSITYLNLFKGTF